MPRSGNSKKVILLRKETGQVVGQVGFRVSHGYVKDSSGDFQAFVKVVCVEGVCKGSLCRKCFSIVQMVSGDFQAVSR